MDHNLSSEISVLVPSLPARLRALAVVFLQWEIRRFIKHYISARRILERGGASEPVEIPYSISPLIMGQVLSTKQKPPLTSVR